MTPWLLGMGMILCSLAASTRAASSLSTQEPLRAGVELLTIDVQVTPSKDAPFRDFAATDFDVRISGRNRPVAASARLHLDEASTPQLGSDAAAACVFGFHRRTNRPTVHYRLGIAPASSDRGARKVEVNMTDRNFQTQWSMWRLPIRR